jgi:hypothetical protein
VAIGSWHLSRSIRPPGRADRTGLGTPLGDDVAVAP